MWVRHSNYETIIKEGWQKGEILNIKELSEGLLQCGQLLSKWNRDVFGNNNHCIKLKELKLEKLFNDVKGISNATTIKKYKKELVEPSLNEEIMWKKRAKTIWLKKGDQNMWFFHGVATRRRRNNEIFSIKVDDDIWMTEPRRLKGFF